MKFEKRDLKKGISTLLRMYNMISSFSVLVGNYYRFWLMRRIF